LDCSKGGSIPLSERRSPMAIPDNRPEEDVVYTRYITLRNGKRLYAFAYGLNAFRIVVRRKKRS